MRTHNSYPLISGLLKVTHVPNGYQVIFKMRLNNIDNMVDDKPLTCGETDPHAKGGQSGSILDAEQHAMVQAELEPMQVADVL